MKSVFLLFLFFLLPFAFALNAGVRDLAVGTPAPYYAGNNITFDLNLFADTNQTLGILIGKANNQQFFSQSIDVNDFNRSLNVAWSNNALATTAGTYVVNFEYIVAGDASSSDNNKSLNLTILRQSSGVDLTITDINWEGNFRTGEAKNIFLKIKNQGSQSATNAYVKVWHTSEVPASLIFINSFNLTNGADINFIFSFTPLAPGSDVLIFKADPEDIIPEDLENNNREEKLINIIPQDLNEFQTANALFFDIREECKAFISNGDYFLSEGLTTDENTGVKRLKFKLIDALGQLIMQGNEPEGYQIVLPGRTFRIMSVSAHIARAMLIYQQPYQVRENTCAIDVQDLIDKFNFLQVDYQRIQTILSEEQARRGIEESGRTTCEANLSTCNNSLSQIQADKSTISTQLDLQTNDCIRQKGDMQLQFRDDLGKELDEKGKVIDDWTTIAMSGWGFFFGMIIIIGALLILRKKQREVLP